jgi:hypothetical protein
VQFTVNPKGGQSDTASQLKRAHELPLAATAKRPGRTQRRQQFEEYAMPKAQRDDDARSNRLLGALETASCKRIDPHLEPTKLKLGAIVCEAGGLLKHAYFPQGTVLRN